jgi:hypothetical protein
MDELKLQSANESQAGKTRDRGILASASILLAVRGILPRPTRGVRAGGEYSWTTRKAELSVKMPDSAGNMPALPQK